MKTIFRILIVSLTLFISCQGNEGSPQALAESGPEANVLIMGHALRVNTPLMRIYGDDTGDQTTRVRWADQMDLGERVATGETRRMTYCLTGNAYYFIAVRRDTGAEGWSWATEVAPGGNLAVAVAENANLYRGPRAIQVIGTALTRKAVVVYHPETETDGFVQIRGFDPGRGVNILAGKYVRRASLSMSNCDIQSSILLQTALALPEYQPQAAARREALLGSALRDHPDSVFFPEVLEIASPGAALPSQPAGIIAAVVRAPAIVHVSDEDYYAFLETFYSYDGRYSYQ